MYIIINWDIADATRVSLAMIQHVRRETNFDLVERTRYSGSDRIDPQGLSWFLVADF